MKKQRDCRQCGKPVGRLGRELCCECWRRRQHEQAKHECSGCGLRRQLQADTGRCRVCSRTCADCAAPVRRIQDTHCRACRRRHATDAAKRLCPRCGKMGLLREHTGWCGLCSRPPMPRKPLQPCVQCGQRRKNAGFGMCNRCWQRQPHRPFVRAENLAAELEDPPPWLPRFAAFTAEHHCVGRACDIIGGLGRLLREDPTAHPQTLVERAQQPGRSMGTMARTLEEFFVDHGLALPTDHGQQLAAGRRHRRVQAVPEPLRSAVAAFERSLVNARARAARAGTRPRSDNTLETHLTTVRDFARFLIQEREITDWASVDVSTVEAFLATKPAFRKSRLSGLRQFFRFARGHRLILVDPTRQLTAREPRGFRGAALTPQQQRDLFRRWTTESSVHPHESFIGLLALLHGASCEEMRHLTITKINHTDRTVYLGRRPHPVPLDPASWTALQACLDHRRQLGTANPHVVVTKVTRTGQRPASGYYFSHVLDQAHVRPKILRCTRLVDLVNNLDPKLVAAAFGMSAPGVLAYFADRIDPTLEANL